MTSFFDLQKYAATGIASPSMTYYDRMRASTLMGGVMHTLTGIPPLSFKADGTPLISWSMKGNGSQTGTPTPDNPVMPEFVGVRTGNLVDSAILQNGYYGALETNYPVFTSDARYRAFQMQLKAGTYTLKISAEESIRLLRVSNNIDGLVIVQTDDIPYTFTLSRDTSIYVSFRNVDTTDSFTNLKIMLNSGSTAIPYEPYGYKIPITCGGETTTVNLGQAQTVRRVKKLVFDGTESWSENVSSENTFRARLALSQANINSTEGYCSHLPFVATGISQDIPLAGFYNSAAFLRFDRNMVNNITEFKAYLAAQYANGTPVTIWYVLAEPTTGIVNEPLAKIGDYCDELSSTDAGVAILTEKGANTLTVGGDLQPSEMTITYRG